MKNKKQVNKKPVVIAYDVQHDKIRLKVSKMLEKYGKRANKSVFECLLTQSEETKLKEKLDTLIDNETDSVLFYNLCKYCYAGQWKTGQITVTESILFA